MIKSYYSCLDAKLTSPQSEQHLVCQSKAKKENGEIVFYGLEEYRVFKLQPFIYEKLINTPNLDGVIFFTINQFCYSDKFNISLICKIIRKKLEIHFAREDISFTNLISLKKSLPLIYSYFHSFKNDRQKNAQIMLDNI